jgi:phage shock protein PspC (stress-responsive transcriptional regulator)
MNDEARTPDDQGAERPESETGPTEQLPPETGPTEQQPPAETGPTEEAPSATEAQKPRRLLRSRSDRMIAGVAGGLARYFDVDPVIFRIAFGVSVFFGGLGILAYIALAIFVPTGEEGQAEKAAPYERQRWLGVAVGVALVLALIPAVGFGFWWGGGWGAHWGLLWLAIPALVAFGAYAVLRDRRERGVAFSVGGVIAASLLVIATLFGFGVLAVGGAFATATGHGMAIALAVVVVGLLLVGAAFRGGARWLIIPAAALATGVGVAAAADLDWSGGIGDREYRPATAASIPADGYELGIGRLIVDLRDIDWRQDQVIDLDVDQGIGQMVIGVPSDVCVASETEATGGDLEVTGEQVEGTDVDRDPNIDATATPRLELHGELDFGQMVVVNDDTRDLEEAGGDRFHGDDPDQAAMRDAAAEACSA